MSYTLEEGEGEEGEKGKEEGEGVGAQFWGEMTNPVRAQTLASPQTLDHWQEPQTLSVVREMAT